MFVVDKTKKNKSEDVINSDMYTEIEDKSETKRPRQERKRK